MSEIKSINGPIVTVGHPKSFTLSEMVFVGKKKCISEVIGIKPHHAVLQVYESTTGLKPGDPATGTGRPFSVAIGPGIIGNIFDGIQRPLKSVSDIYIGTGIHIESLDNQKKWAITVTVKTGDTVSPGAVIAEVAETPTVVFKVLVPGDASGIVTHVVPSGDYTITETLVTIDDHIHLTMTQSWPVRTPRPVLKRKRLDRPLITGQRIIDSLFPVAKGGIAAIPGGFGTGKTQTSHQLAKWSDADIIVYIGCGERGNEMTEVLEDFTKLTDPRTGQNLMDRTVLIANTSNMPVAAREASIYTGITIAEAYRDMGYHVAVMADSTSRWAEALRELSGRLEEMPAEEGFPAYLASRLSEFYERAGYVKTLSGLEGSVTIIGAVSPQGSDFSEPVTRHTKRFVRCFWALDKGLAYARHFPAIHWLGSYSEYIEDLKGWYGGHFIRVRAQILQILFEESELLEIVKLIGADALPDRQRLILSIGRVVRVGFTQQNAYHKTDTYMPFVQQLKLMELILHLYETCQKSIASGISITTIENTGIFEKMIGCKYQPPECWDEITLFSPSTV